MTTRAALLAAVLILSGCASGPSAPGAGALAEFSGDTWTLYWTELDTGSGAERDMVGVYACRASGTWTGGGSLTLQTRLADRSTWVAITAPTELVGATGDTAWVELRASQGRYRPTITGTVTDVDLECRRLPL